eukprot:6769217-Prymnesium_polylepis.1
MGNGRYEGQRPETRVHSGVMQPSGHVGAGALQGVATATQSPKAPPSSAAASHASEGRLWCDVTRIHSLLCRVRA